MKLLVAVAMTVFAVSSFAETGCFYGSTWIPGKPCPTYVVPRTDSRICFNTATVKCPDTPSNPTPEGGSKTIQK
jgi:hypothetical protein